MKQSAIDLPIGFFGSGRENAEVSADLAPRVAGVLIGETQLNGPQMRAFESEIARISNRRHGVAVNSATDGLFFALVANGIGPGDEVLVPACSFAASASGIVRAGATPVFVDISLPTATMDLEDAATRITARSRAMIWVGLYGGLTDPVPIEAFAKDHGLVLIEDAAQSFGAFWSERHAGGTGAASVFSFDRNKVLGAPGTGGAIVTDDDEIASQLRSLRYHGKDGRAFARLGYNSQMSEVTAATLNVKLDYHDRWCVRRRDIAQLYEAALIGKPAEFLEWSEDCTHACHKFVFQTDAREAWRAHLDRAGIPTQVHYKTPLPQEPLFAAFTEGRRPWPVAEAFSARALSLPIYAQLTDAEVSRITNALADF